MTEENITDSITVELSSPIEVAGEMTNKLTFRKPNFGDFIKADAATTELGKTAVLFSRCGKIAPYEVESLDMCDVIEIMEKAIAPFMTSPQKKRRSK